MAANPQRFFNLGGNGFRTVTGAILIGGTATATPGSTNVATIVTYAANATGSSVLHPLNTNTGRDTIPSSGSTSGYGMVEQSYSHTNQATLPTQISGTWTFVYSASGATVPFTGVVWTVCVYAVATGGASRFLFKHASGSASLGAVEGNVTDSFDPGAQSLSAGEILLYEFYVTVGGNSNATSQNVVFRMGSAGVALTIPSIQPGPTIIADPSQALAGVLSFAGAQGRATSYHQTAALSFAGAKTVATTRSVAATLSFAGATAKSTARSLTAAALRFTGAIGRTTGRPLAGVLSFTGSRQTAVAKKLAATLSFVGTLTRSALNYHPTLTATLSFVGKTTKGTGRSLAAQLSAQSASVVQKIFDLLE